MYMNKQKFSTRNIARDATWHMGDRPILFPSSQEKPWIVCLMIEYIKIKVRILTDHDSFWADTDWIQDFVQVLVQTWKILLNKDMPS